MNLAGSCPGTRAALPGMFEPGWGRIVNIASTGRSREKALGELVKHNPQGRLVRPEEVANAVLWLCQPGSESVTGQAISVSGGETM